MMGVDTLELTASEYVVTPSESVRSWDVVPFYKSMLSMDTKEYHLFDVRTADRDPVLEVAIVFEKDVSGEGFIQHGSVDKRLVVRTPDGEPQFTIERTGYTPTYEVESRATRTEVATFSRGLIRWKILDGTGTDVAVVKKPIGDRLRNALSFSQHATHVVESSTEGSIARFEETRAEGGPSSWLLSEMTVELSTPPSIPTEIPVALALTLLHHDSGTSDIGGD